MTPFGMMINAPKPSSMTVTPVLISSSVSSGKLKFVFSNQCWTGDTTNLPSVAKIDKVLLKKKLEDWIRPSDRKYIKLESFDTSRSIFVFDIDKWFDDAVVGVTPNKSMVKFQKTYVLKKEVPFMVRIYGNLVEWRQYVNRNFKDYCRKHPQIRKTVFNMVTDEIEKVMRVEAVNFFDYDYNYSLNAITVTLKSFYQAMVMDAIVREQMAKRTGGKTLGFDRSVNAYIKCFAFWAT